MQDDDILEGAFALIENENVANTMTKLEEDTRSSCLLKESCSNLYTGDPTDLASNLTSNSSKQNETSTSYRHLSDDMRISKLIRRLCSENNATEAIGLCNKLEIVILDPSNASYIRRSFDYLAETIITILQEGPKESLDNVSKIFGLLGYVIRHDFGLYKNWIFKKYEQIKSIRIYLMKSLLTTIKYDSKNMDLINHSERLIISLKDLLETTETAENFIAVSETISEFASNYKISFEKHFTDIVDIVIGWHLETEQTEKLKIHCSYVLQSFSDFFLKKLEFTLSLLGQILEDIVTFSENIYGDGKNINNEKSIISPEISVGSFVGAFNSIIKCLANDNKIIAFQLGKTFFGEAIETITQITYKSLRVASCPDTVVSINEFFCIVLNNGYFNTKKIIQIIQYETNAVKEFNDTQISSFLFLLLEFIRILKANIPIEFIGLIMNARINGVRELKFSKNRKHFLSLIKIYHEILLLKNVPLLQEAYKYILEDSRNAMNAISKRNKSNYTILQAEYILNFYISAIAVFATQTSSIIGMYALQPSILDLLVNEFEISNLNIWMLSPTLHNSIITLISIHCIKNNNYILSSSLFVSNVFSKLALDDRSPTSENFSIILKFLWEIMDGYKLLNIKICECLIDWLYYICNQCISYSELLQNNQIFIGICIKICKISILANDDIILKCGKCIDIILKYNFINSAILTTIGEVCFIHLCSTNSNIRKYYGKILSKLPLKISLGLVKEMTGLAKNQETKINELEHQFLSSAIKGNIKEMHFKNFIENISFNENAEFNVKNLINIFNNSWLLEKSDFSIEFVDMAKKQLTILLDWLQWETSEYCVNNKLRTAFGKPHETFLKIENIIKERARILALKDNTNIENIKILIANQKNSRILLGFLECLEKVIYNASEGTAFAMPEPEKPARTFFKINSPTCIEWFNRNRSAVNLISLHSLQPEIVIRCSDIMLKGLILTKRTNEIIFDHTLISYVWALLRNNETEALYGLYQWIKHNYGKRLIWIKCSSEHAAGHREKAAEGYLNILNNKNIDEKLDSYVRDFITDQLIDCLYFTHQWIDLKNFLANESDKNDLRVTLPIYSITESQIDDIINLESNEDASLIHLSDWEILDKKFESFNNISFHKILSLTENTLASLILTENNEIDSKLEICSNVIQAGIEECLHTKSNEQLNNLLILNHVSYKIEELHQKSEYLNLNSFDVDITFGSLNLTRIAHWKDYLNNKINSKNTNSYDLCLKLAALARNEGNLKLCRQELEKFFKRNKIENIFNIDDKNFDLLSICKILQENGLNCNIWDNNLFQGATEAAKWLYHQTDMQNDAIQLAASCCLGAISNVNRTLPMPEYICKFLLTISEWLLIRNENIINNDENEPLYKLLLNANEIKGLHEDKANDIIPKLDRDVGKVIEYSVKQCSNYGKAWGILGNWCYRWGRKIVEARTTEKGGLQSIDINLIKSLIPDADEYDIESIVNILNQHQVTADDEEIGSNYVSSTELIVSQLRCIKFLTNIDKKIIQSILEIWRKTNKNVYGYYEMAADSYFKFLKLTSDINQQSINNLNEINGDCSTVTATLRLLRLIVKHALGLQDVLEDGLSTTPTSPWKVIIPQLFSRLNHHEPYVRKRVSELLCRVAKDSPHLIIFPTVVGAAQEIRNDLNINDNSTYINDDDNNLNNKLLAYCFNSLLNILSKQTPETVKHVQLLVCELKRVTLLWDEFWLHSLTQLYSEYSDIFNSFELEVRKADQIKYELLQKKYSILMKYVSDDLRRLLLVTSRLPETNYENNFQTKYSNIIKIVIDGLSMPLNFNKPNIAWLKIKQLYVMFQQKIQKNAQTTLKMADISPILAKMKNTAISMPGVETNDKKQIYIKSIDNTVYILPTKTKPKKLAFFGNDGKQYTYLFKGLEDLHLDERIMQFLSISNSMISKSNDCNGNTTIYRAQHYSVIPLGSRSGLISWVDNVTPIFAIYKKWQQRESINPKNEKHYEVMRPSELFYSKLTPLLNEINLKTIDNRKTWPINILRKVLDELKNETPKDLLAKEFWCISKNSADWRKTIRTYTISVAVMSTIGYIIGLGDRHLDNVLVKLTTGEIVHIDYNVCFEKGKTLRVPEKVPFRMTPNFEDALGITGIEGTFRSTCEHVLKTLRKERETLLTLLEAFVYDPLVDWAVSDDGTTTSTRTTKALVAAAEIAALGSTKNSTENETNFDSCERKHSRKKFENDDIRDTLSSRFAEIKPEWTQYRDDVNEQLLQMIEHLDKLEEQREQMKDDETQRTLLTKQIAMIREVDTLGSAMGSHPLNTLSQRYSLYRQALDEFNEIKQSLKEYQIDWKNKFDSYFSTISEIGEIEINKILLEIDDLCKRNQNYDFQPLKDFMENSSQGNMFLQFDQAIKELNSSLLQQSFIVKIALDAMLQYASVIKYYPRSFLENHRFAIYYQLCEKVLNTPENCDLIIEEFKSLTNDECQNTDDLQRCISYAKSIERFWIAANFKLTNNMDLVQTEIPGTNETLLKEAHEALALFHQVEQGSDQAIKFAILTKLTELWTKYSNIENLCKISLRNNPSKISTIKWVLSNQATFILLSVKLAEILSFDLELNKKLLIYVQALDNLNLTVQSIKELKLCFQVQIIPELFQILAFEEPSNLILIEKLMIFPHNEPNKGIKENIKFLKKDLENTELGNLLKIIENELEKVFEGIESYLIVVDEFKHMNEYSSVDHVMQSKQLLSYDIKVFKKEKCELEQSAIQILIETIKLSHHIIQGIKDNNLQIMPDPIVPLQPILNYISECQTNFLLGIGSYILSLLEIKLISELTENSKNLNEINISKIVADLQESNISAKKFSISSFKCALTICNNQSVALKQILLTENLKQNIEDQKISMKTLNSLCVSHAWMHEKYLTKLPTLKYNISKSKLLINIQSAVQTLSAWQISIKKINDELSCFTNAIVQLLKWAAGANLNLVDLQNFFNETLSSEKDISQKYTQIASTVLQYCSSILTFELSKSKPKEIQANDEKYILLISHINMKYKNYKQKSDDITSVEKALVQLLDPEGTIDHNWISNILQLLDEMNDTMQQKIAQLEKDLIITQDNLQLSAHKLRSLLNNELRMDIRYLLKLILKIDGSGQAARYKQFQAYYKRFMERINELSMRVLSKDFTEEIVKDIRIMIHDLIQELDDIHNDLFQLIAERNSGKTENKSLGTPVKELKKGNQPEQKRNAYAVSVWRRIRMKLEGRDPDPNRRLTVAEQVDWMIREAMNPDNLAVLYEGWTPWV